MQFPLYYDHKMVRTGNVWIIVCNLAPICIVKGQLLTYGFNNPFSEYI